MPSQRKRIGFLPSEEVHKIIDKLCRINNFSQSKITGLLVEEALRSRGVLRDSLSLKSSNSNNLSNDLFEKESISKNTPRDNDVYTVNKELFIEDMKMIHEFIEFKYFKRVMNKNKNIFDE